MWGRNRQDVSSLSFFSSHFLSICPANMVGEYSLSYLLWSSTNTYTNFSPASQVQNIFYKHSYPNGGWPFQMWSMSFQMEGSQITFQFFLQVIFINISQMGVREPPSPTPPPAYTTDFWHCCY